MFNRWTAILVVGLAAIATTAWFVSSRKPETGPKQVFLYGDSLSVETAPWLRSRLTRWKTANLVNRSFPGSAPCDWFSQAVVDARTRPAAVIIQTFGNNQSGCQLTKAGNRPRSEGDRYWRDYRYDLRRLARTFPRSTRIYMIAPPTAYNDKASGRSHKGRMLRTMEKAAYGVANARVIDAGRAAEGPGGTYSRVLPCLPREVCSNSPKRGFTYVRAEDGLHFCPTVLKATVQQLTRCPVKASGAWRYANAQANPIIRDLGLDR